MLKYLVESAAETDFVLPMFEAMLAAARERGVRQVELDYIDGNDRARALYEKMGFVRIAEHPDAIRLKDGSFRSLVFMMKKF